MKQETFIESVADRIADLGLAGPAILLLEANKPLAFVGSQLLLVAQPTLNLFFPSQPTQNTIDLLADSTQLECLIATLETTQQPIGSQESSAPQKLAVEERSG